MEKALIYNVRHWHCRPSGGITGVVVDHPTFGTKCIKTSKIMGAVWEGGLPIVTTFGGSRYLLRDPISDAHYAHLVGRFPPPDG